MIIDGEKYACEACVRGHRVSNCQHADRPLQHINKKGRPVSQCQHCRSMRKSRSAHIKCDCGEKSSKCAHLQPAVDGHKETCCCNHGGRCTCAHRKESILDTVPESDSEGEASHVSGSSQSKSSSSSRRRANTSHSDISYGHQRIPSKSAPFQLSRANSSTSTSSMSAMDSRSRARAGSAKEQRRVKSETTSPLVGGHGFVRNGLPPLDLSHMDYVNGANMDLFGMSEQDAPMYSAGLSAPSVDWSNIDWANVRSGNFTPSNYSQATHSYNGMFEFGNGSEHLPQLATTSTSGDVSEVEDFMPGVDNDFDDSFSAGNGFLRHSVMDSPAALSTIDYANFYKGSEQGPMAGAGVSMVEEDPAFWIQGYSDTINAMDDHNDPLTQNQMNGYWDA